MGSTLYERAVEKGEAKGEVRAYADIICRRLQRWIADIDPAVKDRLRSSLSLETLRRYCDEADGVMDLDGARQLLDKIEQASQA